MPEGARAGLVAWLTAEMERERDAERRAIDPEDGAFRQGMADAYELTIREVESRGIY